MVTGRPSRKQRRIEQGDNHRAQLWASQVKAHCGVFTSHSICSDLDHFPLMGQTSHNHHPCTNLHLEILKQLLILFFSPHLKSFIETPSFMWSTQWCMLYNEPIKGWVSFKNWRCSLVSVKTFYLKRCTWGSEILFVERICKWNSPFYIWNLPFIRRISQQSSRFFFQILFFDACKGSLLVRSWVA